MPFNDGIDRRFCFSLTDFHEFETCPFRFFVRHHLGKKYELEDPSDNLALGCLLDQAIKIFHNSKAYGQPPEYLQNLVKASCNLMKDRVVSQKGQSFYSSLVPLMTPELCEKASEIFQNYYVAKEQRIKETLGEVGFCEWVIKTQGGQKYKLWGGPDAYELGRDGVPEVCDYKYRENIERGKDNMDMDLMPKIYMLLACKYLLSKGYKTGRFVVRFWLDPTNEDFYEEFDLESVCNYEQIFLQKIERIVNTFEVGLCERSFCKACNSEKKEEYLIELENLGISLFNNNEREEKEIFLTT